MLQVFIDGASRGNPGSSGIGILIYSKNILLLKHGEYIGFKNNLESEYIALKRGLQLASEYDDEITIFSDSLSTIKKIRKNTRIRKRELKVISRQIKNLETRFNNLTYIYIPRRKNFQVDRLANEAIDNYFKYIN
ncbi:MAG: ribonuclease HI family protein [Nitrososphaeraceae archaeon]